MIHILSEHSRHNTGGRLRKSLVSAEHNAREQCCSNTIIGLAFTGPSPQ